MPLKRYKSAFHALFPVQIADNLVAKADAMIAIKNLIDEQGWTRAVAAKKLGVTTKVVSNLINGKINELPHDLPEEILRKFRSSDRR